MSWRVVVQSTVGMSWTVYKSRRKAVKRWGAQITPPGSTAWVEPDSGEPQPRPVAMMPDPMEGALPTRMLAVDVTGQSRRPSHFAASDHSLAPMTQQEYDDTTTNDADEGFYPLADVGD